MPTTRKRDEMTSQVVFHSTDIVLKNVEVRYHLTSHSDFIVIKTTITTITTSIPHSYILLHATGVAAQIEACLFSRNILQVHKTTPNALQLHHMTMTGKIFPSHLIVIMKRRIAAEQNVGDHAHAPHVHRNVILPVQAFGSKRAKRKTEVFQRIGLRRDTGELFKRHTITPSFRS